MEQDNLLCHAVINQLEADLNEQEYDSLDELITQLVKDEKTKKILIEYLSDTVKEFWLEGKTTPRF
jgi:hypothetical protein